MKDLLCNARIFAGLDEEAIKLFLEHAERMELAADAVIVNEGETNRFIYLIEAGAVRIVKKYETREPVVLAVLGTGEMFGEMCILDTLPRSASCVAVGNATVVKVAAGAFSDLYHKLPKQHSILLLNIARDLSRRLRLLDEVFAGRQ